MVPTILEAAQGASPSAKKNDTRPELHGKSLLSLFASDDQATHNYLWWSHEGNRAFRLVNWKLVAAKNEPWELYDLTSDRSESANLAEKMPDKAAELAKLWEAKQTEFEKLAKP